MNKLTALFIWLTLSLSLNAQIALGPTVSTFAVLGGSTVTNAGPSVINGHLGVSPGTAITGITGIAPGGPGIVLGQIHSADPFAAQAQIELTAAYNAAAGAPSNATIAGDLGGLTLFPGVYTSSSSIGLTGTLTLDGQGNSNSQFIFQIGTSLTGATGSAMVLINGAQASNVFWKIGSSATLGTNSAFVGNILAQASISLGTGGTLQGRALARTGAVTLLSNVITNPGGVVIPQPTPTVTCASGSGRVGTAYISALGAIGGFPPYTFSITGNILPAGLTLNASTGAITGTPTATGTFPYTARVVDSANNVATTSCSIAISAATGGPSVTCVSGSGQVGQAFDSSLSATGGTPPYTFSITAGSLPTNLSLNSSTGAITGTPTTAGPFAYTSRVVDSLGSPATSACSILISVPAAPPVPAPSSLILVTTALACIGIFRARDRLLNPFRKS